MRKMLLLTSCLCLATVMAFGQKAATLRIIIHTNPATVTALQSINDKFMAKYPNIKVQMEDVPITQYPQLKQSRIAAGDVDIVENQTGFDLNIQPFMKGVNIPDWLTYVQNGDYLEITGQPFVKNWDPVAIKDACLTTGKFTSLIWEKSLSTVYSIVRTSLINMA